MIHFIIFRLGEESLLFFIFKCIIMVIFIYLNIIVLVFLRKHRMAPSNTMILIRGQTLCSLLIIVDIVFYNFIEDEPMNDFRYAILICYFINHRYSYWFFISFCTLIIILLSIDRFICIVIPFKYILLRRHHFYLVLILSFVVSVLSSMIFFETISIISNNVKNTTIFTCVIQKVTTPLSVVHILFMSCNIFTFVILNTVTSVYLWKSIKNRSNLSENLLSISKNKLSVRFSMANIVSTFICVVIFFTFCIIKLVLVFRIQKKFSINTYVFIKYVYLFTTPINSIMYLILFRNFRKFVICKLK